MTNRIIVTLQVVFLSHLGFSQSIDTVKLNNYFNELGKHNKFMGSVAITENGKLIYTKSVGFSDVESKRNTNEKSIYRIGSVTKTFTSVLVMKAAEEKKLRLDQSIETHFPRIKNAGKITIFHLLSHRSGIHDFTQLEEYSTWFTEPKTQTEMLALISKGGSDFEPGSKTEYSNSNYVLLTFILERCFKTPYADLLTKYITKPLELPNTRFGDKIEAERNNCYSYRFSDKWEKEAETNLSIPLGAGGIVSIPTEMVKFSDGLFNGKIISAKSLELMKDSGFGVFKIPFYDKTSFGHTGSIDGFTSVLSHFPNENISYALTCNGNNYNNNNISIAVLSAVFNKPYEIPDFKVFEVSSTDLDNYIGNYSSTEIPLKINILKDGNVLKAEIVGQATFPLRATAKDEFRDDNAGAIFEFNPTKKILLLKQRGKQISFSKN